ncbi:WW domain binding protein 4 [Coemansia erecta]|uniref:WW domain binding protein 4 n=1 Tax=Coemansia erecta TaxID=147472 RepID=A0A9W7Y404_9FUNG|nr:WW domain binding protein 4 [Coemansia erecta]
MSSSSSSQRKAPWVHNTKYWCQYCQIFVQDNKSSRAMHDNGAKHKGNVEKYLRKIDKVSKDRDDAKTKLRTELDKIEKAAALRYSKDTGAQAGSVEAPPAKSSIADSTAKPSDPADVSPKKIKETVQRPDNIGIVGAWEVVEETQAADVTTAASATKDQSATTRAKRARSPSEAKESSTTAHSRGSEWLDGGHDDPQDDDTFEIKEKTIGSVYATASSYKHDNTANSETATETGNIQFKKRRTASNRSTARKQRNPL